MRRFTRAFRLRCLLVAAACMLAIQPVHAVGTLTVTTLASSGITRYSLAWTSDAAGAVSANRFAVRAGEILQVKFIPSSSAAPTALYDVTLIDDDSVDVLGGEGADLSATVATLGVPLVDAQRIYLDGRQRLDLVVANAGNAKQGTVLIWVR